MWEISALISDYLPSPQQRSQRERSEDRQVVGNVGVGRGARVLVLAGDSWDERDGCR